MIPPFDWSAGPPDDPDERMRQCMCRVRAGHTAHGTWDLFGLPPVPDTGASEDELSRLEAGLAGALPAEYRAFLGRWRHLILDDSARVWGLGDNGVGLDGPWVSEKHRAGVGYLVFADYWLYADGDQLLFPLDDPARPVVAYLHEHGPLYEAFAPSFSLAVWRMVAEWEAGYDPAP